MPFGMCTLVGQRNYVLGRGPDLPMVMGTFEEYDVRIFPHAAERHSSGPDVGMCICVIFVLFRFMPEAWV